MRQINEARTTHISTALALRCVFALVLCLALVGCLGSSPRKNGDPWPLAEGGTPLEDILTDEEMRSAVLRVLNAEKPWKLKGIDPDDGDRLIEGLPNELDRTTVIEAALGTRPWTTGRDTIRKGTGFAATYQLSDVVPEGYTRVEAFVGGWDEEGYHSTIEFVVIVREEDHVPVLAAMTSITSNDAPPLG